jgi:DNA-binding response OmpR family regulator
MKPLTVLIAEDDLLSRMVLERSVVQWGHHMISAVDGESALKLLRSRSVDVCILDWDMPKVTGVEICKWLRKQTKTPMPYVVLITARNHPREIQAGYEAGADDYLTKPCDMKYLRRRMTIVAEKIRRQERLDQVSKKTASDERSTRSSPADIYLADLRLLRRKS